MKQEKSLRQKVSKLGDQTVGPHGYVFAGPRAPAFAERSFYRDRDLARVAARCPLRAPFLLPPTSLSRVFDILALCARGRSPSFELLVRLGPSSAHSSLRVASVLIRALRDTRNLLDDAMAMPCRGGERCLCLAVARIMTAHIALIILMYLGHHAYALDYSFTQGKERKGYSQ